jgi:raffinose/stachyose/melibiose transport system permease protein
MLGLYDKFFTLIIPYIAIRLPLSIFLFESFIKTIPIELDEAAYMDGASTFFTMTRIIFPVCKPVMSTIVILAFLDTWNEFPFALVLVTKNIYRTLPVGLTNFYGQYTTNYTTLMAALVLSILPVIIVYLLFYKKVMQGMTAGAVKG